MSNEIDFEVFNRQRDTKPEKKEAIRKTDKKRKKKTALVVKIAVSVFAALILLLFVYFAVTPFHSPARVVDHYIKAAVDEDWGTVYKYTAAKSSPFVSKKDFVAYCQENPSNVSLTESPIVDFEIINDKTDDKNYYYSVNYVCENKENGVLYLTVNKAREGFWLFDLYEVIPEFDCITPLTVYAPENTTVMIDGKKIVKSETVTGSDSVSNNEYSYLKFTVPYVLKGSYEISAANPNCEKITQTVDTNESNECFLSMNINEDTYNKLCENASQYISQFYSGVIDNSIDISSFPVSSDFTAEKFSAVVDSISEELYKSSDNYSITSVTVTDYKVKTDYENANVVFGCQNQIDVEVRFDFNYDYTTKSVKTDGSEITENKSDSGQFNVYYTYENGEWKILDISQNAWF